VRAGWEPGERERFYLPEFGWWIAFPWARSAGLGVGFARSRG
jgi:hypothetical protein